MNLLTRAATRSDKPLKWRLLADLLVGTRRVLDTGCGSGELARFLASEGFEVSGVDVRGANVVATRALGIEAHVADLNDAAEWDRLVPGHDAVLVSDVLEHLVNGEEVLRRLPEAVAPGTVVVLSVPNVAFWRVRFQLLRGRWEYQDEGILDRTHVRFYTAASLTDLIHSTALVVDEWWPLPATERDLSSWRGGIHAMLALVFPTWFATGMLVRLRA